MDKVFFIGVHNKPGLRPLCASTRSGKMIDQIIGQLKAKCVKTNFINANEAPNKLSFAEREAAGWYWIIRTPYKSGDTVVLLGKYVQKYFPHWLLLESEIIEIPHPAYPKSKEAKQLYIEAAVDQINSL